MLHTYSPRLTTGQSEDPLPTRQLTSNLLRALRQLVPGPRVLGQLATASVLGHLRVTPPASSPRPGRSGHAGPGKRASKALTAAATPAGSPEAGRGCHGPEEAKEA